MSETRGNAMTRPALIFLRIDLRLAERALTAALQREHTMASDVAYLREKIRRIKERIEREEKGE